MLDEREAFFQSIKSIKYVCYRASEVTDESLQRLLRELPGAGVALIELDAFEKQCARQRWKECAAGSAQICVLRRGKLCLQALKCAVPEPEATLLLAGTPQTLALAAGTPMATVGYGLLAEPEWAPCGAEELPGIELPPEASVQADILVEGFDEVDVPFLDRIMKRAQGLPWITVVTRRCFLREITPEDLDDLFALYAQPGITDYTQPLYERPAEEQYTRDYIANMYRFYGYGMWLVRDRKSGALIGRAGFSHQDLGAEIVLEMGYIIGVPYQRQGYATEVCEKLIEFARTNLSDFGTLNCFVEPGNAASHGLLKKLGFAPGGMVKIADKAMVRYQKGL